MLSDNLQKIVQNRYAPVRCGFWWRVRIGTGEQTVGRCYTQTEAMRLAAALTTAFLDGAFVQREQCIKEQGDE